MDALLLRHATNNCYTYGKLTIHSGSEGISLGGNTHNRAVTIRNSSGTSSKYLCSIRSSGSYVGIALGNSNESDYKRVTEIRALSRAAVSSSSIFEENDKWYAVCGSTEYPISERVEIYLDGTDTWLSGTDALISLLSGDYTFSAWFDAPVEDGGQIRVIVVS